MSKKKKKKIPHEQVLNKHIEKDIFVIFGTGFWILGLWNRF